MATVKLFPRLDKANMQGQVPMYLRLTKNRKSKYIALGINIDPKDWNAQSGKVKPNARNAGQINTFLATKEAEAEALALELETRSKLVTAYDIKAKIIGRAPKDFFTFVETHRRILYENLTIGSVNRCNGVVAKLKAFCKGEPLYFDQMSVSFIQSFQQYLSDELHNHVNTIHSNLKVIRKMVLYAITEEMMPADKNPFLKIKLKGEKTMRAFLLDEELAKIEILKLEKRSMLNHHRNLYVFSAYSGGVRISDLLMMRWENFDGEHLIFQIRKTRDELSVKLPEKSLELIAFYRSLAKEKVNGGEIHPRSFIFPLLRIDKNETGELPIFKAISSATAYTNKDLRKISKLAKLEKRISFHTARHSWAVRALQKGMRIEYVSKLMGHASIKQTEVYAKILNKELDNAMAIFNQKRA